MIGKEMGEIKPLVIVDEYDGEYAINEAYRPIAEQQFPPEYFHERCLRVIPGGRANG